MSDFEILDEFFKMQETGGGKVQYICNDGPTSCEACRSKNGKIYDAKSAPQLPIHPNCGCSLVPA